MSELIYTENGWRRTLDEQRHHRESSWDYKGRAIYHITLCVEHRQRLFGTLAGTTEQTAHIELNEMGRYVDSTFRHLPLFYAKKGIKLKILALKVMPDHLHGVIEVVEPMPKKIGEVIRSFKSACTSHYKKLVAAADTANNTANNSGKNAAKMQDQATQQLAAMQATATQQLAAMQVAAPQQLAATQATATQQLAAMQVAAPQQLALAPAILQFCRIFATTGSIWEAMPNGYHERILHCHDQLPRMIAYVKDNPRRLWLKINNPELFTMYHNVMHMWRFRSIGNQFLLDFPLKQYIQCSRSITPEALEKQLSDALYMASMGMVTITAAISKGEQLIARTIREHGYPLIILLKDGFPKEGTEAERHYKPGGVYFNACASAKLLLLEPYKEAYEDAAVAESVYRKAPMAPIESSRYKFLALNYMASTIAAGAQ